MTRRGDNEPNRVADPSSPDPWDFDEVLAYFVTSAYDFLWAQGITIDGFHINKEQIMALPRAEQRKAKAAANILLRVRTIRRYVARGDCKQAVTNTIDLVANARRLMPLDDLAALGDQTHRWRSEGGKEAHRTKRALHPVYRQFDADLRMINRNLTPWARAGLIAERIKAERGVSVHRRTVYRHIRPLVEDRPD